METLRDLQIERDGGLGLDPGKLLYSYAELARMGVASRYTLARWARAGRLAVITLPSGREKVTRATALGLLGVKKFLKCGAGGLDPDAAKHGGTSL